MDWRGMVEEARHILWADIRKSLARVNSWVVPLLLLPLLFLGFLGRDHPFETGASTGVLLIGIIGLRLHIASRENPGHGFMLAFEASMIAAVNYGAGWLAFTIVDRVA
jgi:hypothetical protein